MKKSQISEDEVRRKIHCILAEAQSEHVGETMDAIGKGLMLAMIGMFHVLLFGPPGCNKSGIIRSIFGRVQDAFYFEMLSSMYATKEDFLGPVNMQAMDHGRWERNLNGRIADAHLFYCDETLQMPDSLYPEFHAAMNERIVHNNAKVVPIPLITMAGATNVEPQDTEGIEAFIDRWLLKFMVGQVSDTKELNQIRKVNQERVISGAAELEPTTISLDELRVAQESAKKVIIPDSVNNAFGKIYKKLRTEQVNITNRRAVEVDKIIRASAWLRGSEEAGTEDMSMLTWALWEHPKQIDVVTAVMAEYAKDAESRARELLSAVRSAKSAWEKADNRQKKDELQSKAKSIIQKMNFLIRQKKNEGKNLKPLMDAYREASSLVRDMNSHGQQ